jgi:hypothetical protein
MSRLKIESARRQLGTALQLFLRDRDPVSVHCLANGGCELIEFYAKKAGGRPFTSHILQTWPGLDLPSLRRIQRKYWTAFKHATHLHGRQERDDEELLSGFTDEQNDTALLIGWYDYAQATKQMPVEAQLHQAWYMALHPEKLDSKHASEPYQRWFPNLSARSRSRQKRMLNQAIDKARKDKKIMRDRRTDARPLILDWPPD